MSPATESTLVTYNRRRSVLAAAFLGLVTVVGAARAIAGGSVGGLVITFVVLGAPAVVFAFWAARPRPVFVIGDEALTLARSGRVILWRSVSAARVGTQQGLFGESHHLVLTLEQSLPQPRRRVIRTNATADDEIDLELDWLSLPWREVTREVELRSGRELELTREHAFRSR